MATLEQRVTALEAVYSDGGADFLGFSDEFEGEIFANGGVRILAATSSTPPNERKVRWIRESDGALVADLSAYIEAPDRFHQQIVSNRDEVASAGLTEMEARGGTNLAAVVLSASANAAYARLGIGTDNAGDGFRVVGDPDIAASRQASVAIAGQERIIWKDAGGGKFVSDFLLKSDVGSFKAYRATTPYGSATNTEIVWDGERWDSRGWFNPATGRYTPQVPGRYEFSCVLLPSAIPAADTYYRGQIRRNNSLAGADLDNLLLTSISMQRGVNSQIGAVAHGMITMNGTTDFASVTVVHDIGGTPNIEPVSSYFCGKLVEPT